MRAPRVPRGFSASRQAVYTCGLRFFLVGAEPGSGGCLDALNRWETQRARVAPTPSPPVEERDAAPQTPLRKVRLVCSRGAAFAPLEILVGDYFCFYQP
jgi:hypothetical protein